MGLTGQHATIISWVGFGVSALSFLCSVLNIAVIWAMGKWNGHILLLLSTVLCQITYDWNYMLGPVRNYNACIVWHFLDIVGGLSVSIWTNIVSFIIGYIVYEAESIDIFKNYPIFFMLAVGFPLVLAICEVSISGVLEPYDDDVSGCGFSHALSGDIIQGIYYFGRVASIIVNFAVFASVSLILNKRKTTTTPTIIITTTTVTRTISSTSSNTARSSNTLKNGSLSAKPTRNSRSADGIMVSPEDALIILVGRMQYYPLVQVISRSGAIWDEAWNGKFRTFTSGLMAAIFSPSIGIGYFIVFLVMQPKAWDTFKSMLEFR